jgi:hypothetical protein
MNCRKALFLLASIAVSHYVFELTLMQNFLVNALLCIYLIKLKNPEQTKGTPKRKRRWKHYR